MKCCILARWLCRQRKPLRHSSMMLLQSSMKFLDRLKICSSMFIGYVASCHVYNEICYIDTHNILITFLKMSLGQMIFRSPFVPKCTRSPYVNTCPSEVLTPSHQIYTVSQKSSHLLTVCDFVKSWSILKIFALLESAWNFLQNQCDTTHLTLSMLLHYPGKLKIQISADVEENANKMHFNHL